jgi:hypothetical protein
VRNADEQLVKNVRQAMEENENLRVYFASGGCRDLNGYYTSGVIEGASLRTVQLKLFQLSDVSHIVAALEHALVSTIIQ